MAVERRDDRKKSGAKGWASNQNKGFERTAFNLPDGVEFFKFDKVGVYKVDFLPFIAGKNNPYKDEGMEHFERTYEVHAIPTSDGNRLYCCRMKCFGKKCGACDWMKTNGGNADPKLLKDLRSKTRHLWIVNDKPGSGKNPSVKIFDSNHYNKTKGFGEQMVVVINTLEDEEPFALQGGMTAYLTVEEDFFDKRKYFLVARIDFKPRKYDYDPKLIKSLPCLDDLLIDPGYDKVMQLLETGVTDDEDENKNDQGGDEDAPARKGVASRRETRDSDDEDNDDPKPAAKTRTASVEEDDDSDEDEPRRSPVTGKNGTHKAAKKEDPDEDLDEDLDDEDDDDGFGESDEDEDDDEPAPKKKSRK